MGYENYLFERSLIEKAIDTGLPGSKLLAAFLARDTESSFGPGSADAPWTGEEWADALLLAEAIRPQGTHPGLHDRTQWRREWAVELTWADRVLDRVKEPSTQLGPFQTYAQVEKFIETYLRDRDVTAYRVLERQAAYTEWTGPEGPTEITDEAREAAMQRLFEEMSAPRETKGGIS